MASRIGAADHYNLDPVGEAAGVPGAGLLAFLTRDQLHPPMVDDAATWSEGKRWYEGAVRHTVEALSLCRMRPGQRVLDIGCGVGGPARTAVDEFGVHVTGINISELQVAAATEASRQRPEWQQGTTFLLHDCLEPLVGPGLPVGEPFDGAYCINMTYHVADKTRMFENVRRALGGSGFFLVDDWMVTAAISEDELDALGIHFISAHFPSAETLPEQLSASGFAVERVEDLSHVGKTHMARHFRAQILDHFAPSIRKLPYGEQMVEQFLEAVELTLRLYREGKMVYRRFLARA